MDSEQELTWPPLLPAVPALPPARNQVVIRGIFLPQDVLCTGQVASCLCQDSAAAPAIIPLLSRLKLGEVGPGDTQQSAHPRLDTSLHKHLCNFTNQLSSPCSLQTSRYWTRTSTWSSQWGRRQCHALPPPVQGHEELRDRELETRTPPVTLRKYVALCGPHCLTHCPFQLSSNRTMAAIQVLYLVTTIFQMLIAPKGL